MSYVFYSAWNAPFVLLLGFSTLVDWFLAKSIYLANNKTKKKILLIASVSVNIGLLAFFKYNELLLGSFIFVIEQFGIVYVPVQSWSLVLPVGISFYTFQTMSYSIDVYRGHQKPSDSFLDYALYVSFFPQLVAGPIVRAGVFLPQCKEPKKFDTSKILWGIGLFVVGFFNKQVIADMLMSPIVGKAFDIAKEPTFFTAWMGAIAFSVQIFCDFAGYSTCAIGIALMLGFILPENFRYPYAAVGFSDFWRRWHISLSTWLRDYLYISLGGSYVSKLRTSFNLMVTMLLGGLWHGNTLMFMTWGGIHGGFLVLEKYAKSNVFFNIKGSLKHPFYYWLLSIFTFLCVSWTWVFFRSENFDQAAGMSAAMFGFSSGSIEYSIVSLSRLDQYTVILVVGIMLVIHWMMRNITMKDVYLMLPAPVRAVSLAMIMYASLISMSGPDITFIYFQF